jgi:hypothetical protein
MNRDFEQSTNAAVSGVLFSPVLLPQVFRQSSEWSAPTDEKPFNRHAKFRSQESREESEGNTHKFPNRLFQSSFDAPRQRGAAVDELPVDSAAGLPQSRVFRLFSRVIAECRAALHAFRAPHVPQGCLERSLSDMIRELSPIIPTCRAFATGKSKALKPEIHEQVCLIGREALSNAFRHSQATLIEVEVEYQHRNLRLVVRDNGCGMNPEEVRASRNSHWGLLRMDERARLLGAQLRIWSKHGLGTEVEVSLPV